MTIRRAAVLTRPAPWRAACHYSLCPCAITDVLPSRIYSSPELHFARGHCHRPTHAAGPPQRLCSSLSTTRPKEKLTGVRVIDTGHRKPRSKFHARIVFVNASTLESTRISAELIDAPNSHSVVCRTTYQTRDLSRSTTLRGQQPHGPSPCRRRGVCSGGPGAGHDLSKRLAHRARNDSTRLCSPCRHGQHRHPRPCRPAAQRHLCLSCVVHEPASPWKTTESGLPQRLHHSSPARMTCFSTPRQCLSHDVQDPAGALEPGAYLGRLSRTLETNVMIAMPSRGDSRCGRKGSRNTTWHNILT